MYLLVLDYESDSERKRIDYAIERWQDTLKIIKPKGSIIIVDGKHNRIDEFVKDLCSRLEKSEEKVSFYEINKETIEIEKNTKKITYQTMEKREFVEKFIEYLMSKLSASYEYKSKIGKIYKLYTKKGQATLDISLQDIGDKTNILIAIDGYGDVVDFISEKVDIEMRTFLGVKK